MWLFFPRHRDYFKLYILTRVIYYKLSLKWTGKKSELSLLMGAFFLCG